MVNPESFFSLIGAFLVFFLKPATKRLAFYYAVINVVSVIFLAGFFLRCSTHDIAGVTVSYQNRCVCMYWVCASMSIVLNCALFHVCVFVFHVCVFVLHVCVCVWVLLCCVRLTKTSL